MFKKFINIIIFIIVLLALSTAGWIYFRYQNLHPSTDNAYIQANTTSIAPQINATVDKVLIKENQVVEKNQTLITLDKKPFTIALQKAQANLKNTEQTIKAEQANIETAKAGVNEAQAILKNSEKNTKRILSLVTQKLTSQAQGDQAISDLAVSRASLKKATAELASAKQTLGEKGDRNAAIQAALADVATAQLNLDHTTITSPSSGIIANLSTRPGDQLTAYNPIFSIVSTSSWWVDANFKETQLKHIKVGQKATIKTDIYPDHTYYGIVDSISIGSGNSFALLPAENATGNWVKVTQRFPVKIKIIQSARDARDFPLRLGASATIVIDASQNIKSKIQNK